MSAVSVGLFRSPSAFAGRSMNRYADNLLAALAAAELGDLRVTEVAPALGRALEGSSFRTRLRRYDAVYRAYPRVARHTHLGLNHILDHAYGHLVRALDPERTIVTCFDLFPLQHWRGAIRGVPRRRTRPVGALFSLRSLRRAAAVITPSEATKRDVIELLEVDATRVHVIPLGVDHLGPRPASDCSSTRDILTLSTGGAYKNVRASVEVLARVSRQVDDVRLVRIGAPLPVADRELARRYGVENRIVELGHVPDESLASVYAAAQVMLHPSFYEGFGWPPLEAMASGLPTVVSDWPSLLEIASDAALTADADDYDMLAEHCVSILTQEGAAEDFRARGLRRAKSFTWRRTAEETALVYRSVLDEVSS